MIRFLDGPAQGQALLLRRAPILLRVVVDDQGKWDGLDQIGDKPKFNETVHVYRRVSHDGHMHICARGPGGRGGMSQIAEYRHYEHQPDKATGLHQRLWEEWAHARIAEETSQGKDS